MKMSIHSLIYLIIPLLLVNSGLTAEPAVSLDELERWFLSDELAPPGTSSDSHLNFITTPIGKSVLHSLNEITINRKSIKTGWVKLKQCYENLDPVPEMQVVYNSKTIRKLTVVKSKNIEHVYVKGPSVQLENVEKNAELCISSEVKIFKKDKDDVYYLKNGPFHRQFLDGYFPFQLTLQINYPSEIMRFTNSSPKPQRGFSVEHKNDTIQIESLFTGKLNAKMYFKLIR